MRRRPLGSTGIEVSSLCLGGNVFGWTLDEAGSFAVLDAFVDHGGNFVDTADVYSAWAEGNVGGESEELIGRWLARRGRSDDVVVATKAGMLGDEPRLTRARVLGSIDDSLRRLGVDRIDLFYAHQDELQTPIEETLGALDEAVRAGKVRALGASNYGADRLLEALETSERNGWARYEAIEPKYSPLEREPFESEVAPVAREHGLAVFPYHVLESGYLTGKYRRGASRDTARGSQAATASTPERERVLDGVEAVAAARGATPAQVALAWALAKGVTAPIASATSPEQLAELVFGAEVELTAAEVAALDGVSASTVAT